MSHKKKEMLFKIHVSVDIQSKKILLSMQVTEDKHTYDSKVLPDLVDEVLKIDEIG